MSERLTPDQENEIVARAQAATPGPWELYEGYGVKDYYAWMRGGHLRGVGTLDFGEGDDAEADRSFVLNAREDVLTLAAELKAERADNSQLYSDLTGANLARWEEENDARRGRLAATNARKRAARLRTDRDDIQRYAARLEAEICNCQPQLENGDHLHESTCRIAEIQIYLAHDMA